MAVTEWLGNWRDRPDSALAASRYAKMADRYDGTCHRIEPLRALALQLLDPQPGELIVDVACGTAATTTHLAHRVGPRGRVVGIELSPLMAAIGNERLAAQELHHASIRVGRVEDTMLDDSADALFFSYAHDVLQQPQAIDSLRRMSRPGARYVVLGMRTLPWWWGWPINLFDMWRARRYLTTFRGLPTPWARLQALSREFHIVGAWHAGTSYLAHGTLT